MNDVVNSRPHKLKTHIEIDDVSQQQSLGEGRSFIFIACRLLPISLHAFICQHMVFHFLDLYLLIGDIFVNSVLLTLRRLGCTNWLA